MSTLSVTRRSFVLRAAAVALLVAVVLPGSALHAHDESREVIEGLLHGLVDAGDISESQHEVIDRLHFELGLDRQLDHWFDAQLVSRSLTTETHGYLLALLDLDHAEATAADPAPAAYTGSGNVTLLGRSDPSPTSPYYGDNSSTGEMYNGIWGYAAGLREYALQGQSNGLHIVDVTDPAAPFRVQFVPMAGGRVWRDVATHEASTGKTYAYVGAQSNGNFQIVDLSYLSGATAHGVDSDPIPSTAIFDRGRTNYGHTLAIADGLLFLNSSNSLGCQIFDLDQNPENPPLIGSWSGTQRDCHDSFARSNVPGSGGKDLLYAADGYARSYRILDITSIRSGVSPALVGQTAAVSGIYGHSNWLTDDSHYLYAFEEGNRHDIAVYDVANPASPTLVRTFQYSDDAVANSIVHNGQVRGDYLLVAYYEAGLRVFDISNPVNPVEVGKWETWRDPDGDGNPEQSILGGYDGAWNLDTSLGSGNVLVSDMKSGAFIVRVDPVQVPAPIIDLAAAGGDSWVDLTWSAATGATGYSVLRATTSGGPYTAVASNVVGTNFLDTGVSNGVEYAFIVTATNAGGESGGSNEALATPGSPTGCGDGVCSAGEDCDSCAADCPSLILGAVCGDGVCQAGDGEDCLSCPTDCNGLQTGKPTRRFCCGFGGVNPVGCGPSACRVGGITCTEIPEGAVGTSCCGDLVCEGAEDSAVCALDCGPPPVCGDAVCDPGESACSCASDCGLPPTDEIGLCNDGVDNDCDGLVDCGDAECGIDPFCAPVDCSLYTDRGSCRADPVCKWIRRRGACE